MSARRDHGLWPLFPKDDDENERVEAPAGSDLDVAKRMGEFAFLIRAERRRLELSQADLAAWVGIDRSTLNQIEIGARYPSMELVLKLLSFLKVSSTPESFTAYLDQPGLRALGEEPEG